MKHEAHKALLASIEKWKQNEAAQTIKEVLVEVKDCPLCTLYYSQNSRCCHQCPVRIATGEALCVGTSYTEVAAVKFSLFLQRGSTAVVSPELRYHITKEREFLESLLPTPTPEKERD